MTDDIGTEEPTDAGKDALQGRSDAGEDLTDTRDDDLDLTSDDIDGDGYSPAETAVLGHLLDEAMPKGAPDSDDAEEIQPE